MMAHLIAKARYQPLSPFCDNQVYVFNLGLAKISLLLINRPYSARITSTVTALFKGDGADGNS